MSINELFHNESNESAASNRLLNGTAELTRIANNAATSILRKMEENIDAYRDRIAESATNSKELDAIIEEFKPYTNIEEDHPLRNLSVETFEGMLKSQQSKRSRAKSKTMTLDNYVTLLTAAIAEDILRDLYNKPKSAGNFGNRAGIVDYTPAQLEALAADQDALKREIRNVQSKKSIMKSKDDFDETSDRWQSLLRAEVMLKDLRVDTNTKVVEVDHTKEKIAEMLNGIDLEHLKAADAKDILAAIHEATNS